MNSSCSLNAENTVFVSLDPKNEDFLANCSQKLFSFKVIQIECVHRILFCFSPSVLCKVSSNMELSRAVSYSPLTLNKPLASCKVCLAFTLGSHSRVPPQGPILGSHLKVPPQGPGSHFFGMPFPYFQNTFSYEHLWRAACDYM